MSSTLEQEKRLEYYLDIFAQAQHGLPSFKAWQLLARDKEAWAIHLKQREQRKQLMEQFEIYEQILEIQEHTAKKDKQIAEKDEQLKQLMQQIAEKKKQTTEQIDKIIQELLKEGSFSISKIAQMTNVSQYRVRKIKKQLESNNSEK